MPPSPRWAWPWAFAAFPLGWLVLAWPWLSGTVTIPWDAKAHFYPQLQFLAQSLHRGESPFWAPYVFSGQPQVADPQSLIFAPFYLALGLIDPDPSFRAADSVILLMLALGGVSLMLLFRDRGWQPGGALVAGLNFAFGASAAWRIQHLGQVMSLCWWPLALWLLLRALQRGSVLSGLSAGLAAGCMALGRDQVAYLGLWLLAGAATTRFFSVPGALRSSLRPLFAATLAGALVVAVPVLLTALLAEGSNRPAIDLAGAGRGSLHPALLLTAFVPNLFGADGPFELYWGPPSPRWGEVDLFLARNMGVLYAGALPAILLVLGAVRGALWAQEIRAFTIAFVAVLLYALGRYTPAFAAFYAVLPGIDLFRRPADATFFVGALAAILAGYLVHRCWIGTLPARGGLSRGLEAALIAAPLALGVGLAMAKGQLATAAPALAKAGFCLAVAACVVAVLPHLARRTPVLALSALAGWTVLDLAWNNGPNESTALEPATYDVLRADTADPLLAVIKARLAETASPARLDRLELVGLGFHWPNASLVHRLHNTLGYNPVRLGLYSEATGAGDHAALPDQRRFAPLLPSYRSPLADLLGQRLIATGVPIEQIDPGLRPGDLTLLANTKSGLLYENQRALPRALFAGESRAVDFDELLRTGAWPNADLSRTVLLSDGTKDAGPTPANGTATIVSYRNTEVVLAIDANGPGFAVLNDPWQPWWEAELDGVPAPILRANVLFRAVAVPAGRHTVRFVFRPFAGAWRALVRRFSRSS